MTHITVTIDNCQTNFPKGAKALHRRVVRSGRKKGDAVLTERLNPLVFSCQMA
jgi:hypothetical protein